MGYSNGIVTKPVTTKDIGQAIGSASRQVGVLCTDANINKWAKYKPVDNDSPIWRQKHSDWYIGLKKDCNLNITGGTGSIAHFEYRIIDGWASMLHFDGYNHQAETGLKFKYTEKDYNLLNSSKPNLSIELEDSEDLITVYDIKDSEYMSGWTLELIVAAKLPIGSSYIKTYSLTITKRSIVFSIPWTDLMSLNVNTCTCRVQIRKGNETKNILPAGEGNTMVLNIIADIGVSISGWEKEVYDPVDAVWRPITYYAHYMAAKLDVTGSRLQFGFMVITNNSDMAISSNTTFCHIEWEDGGTTYYVNAPLQRMSTPETDFSLTPGGSTAGYFGVAHNKLPKITQYSVCYFTFTVWREEDKTYYDLYPKTTLNLICRDGTYAPLIKV